MQVPELLNKYGFGKKQLNLKDFEDACEELYFKVFWTDERLDDGLSFPRTRNGRKYRIIILRRTLFYLATLETAWHEFAHAYYEHFGVRAFVRGSEDKYESTANDFALCCLIPTAWVNTKSRNELLDEGFTDEQLIRRKEIYESCRV